MYVLVHRCLLTHFHTCIGTWRGIVKLEGRVLVCAYWMGPCLRSRRWWWYSLNAPFYCVCRDILQLSKAAFKVQQVDVHTRLMRRYKQVPQWWFLGILFITISVAIAACQIYNEQLQLPWWGVAVACMIAFFFTLPIGIIRATTNQVIWLSILLCMCISTFNFIIRAKSFDFYCLQVCTHCI